MAASEHVEDAGAYGFGDADAVILDPDANPLGGATVVRTRQGGYGREADGVDRLGFSYRINGRFGQTLCEFSPDPNFGGLAGFGTSEPPAVLSEPRGEMAGFASATASDPTGEMAGFDSSAARSIFRYRATVSRSMPSSRAIRR